VALAYVDAPPPATAKSAKVNVRHAVGELARNRMLLTLDIATIASPPLFGLVVDLSTSYQSAWLLYGCFAALGALVAVVLRGQETRRRAASLERGYLMFPTDATICLLAADRFSINEAVCGKVSRCCMPTRRREAIR